MTKQATARKLFAEGLVEADASRWTEAADRFGRAYALQPTPEIAYNLSTALIRLGHLVSASEVLRHVAEDANARPAVRAAAAERLSEVRPRLAHVIIDVGSLPDHRVRIDGGPLDPAVVGRPLPVDPGTHVVEVQTGARPPLSRTLSLGEGGQQTISFEEPGASARTAPGLRFGSGGDPAGAVSEGRRRQAPWRQGWFWGIAGGVAAVAIAAAVLTLGRGESSPRGNVDTWVIAAGQ